MNRVKQKAPTIVIGGKTYRINNLGNCCSCDYGDIDALQLPCRECISLFTTDVSLTLVK